jgi:hypothetical protein
MNRLSKGLLAVMLLAGLCALPAHVAGQERKLIAPVRGEADVDITKPNTKVVAGEVVTIITLRNASKGAIAGLKVEENWYDKGGNPVGGDTYRHPRPLPPGEVVTVTLKTPRKPTMNSNQYQFTHANGAVKTKVVPKIDVPKTTS